jgi:hypothetical protein
VRPRLLLAINQSLNWLFRPYLSYPFSLKPQLTTVHIQTQLSGYLQAAKPISDATKQTHSKYVFITP